MQPENGGNNAGREASRRTLSRKDRIHEIGRSWQAALFGEECNTLTQPQIASDGADNESTTVAVCDLRDSRVRLAILQQKGSGSHRATRAGASRLQGKRKS